VDDQQTAAFEFERVTVLRAGRRVLNKVTASLPVAGITVVSGPSGAGKTTLLRLCNRPEIPDSGRVCYRGQPLDELDPLVLCRKVGMVFQRSTPSRAAWPTTSPSPAAVPGQQRALRDEPMGAQPGWQQPGQRCQDRPVGPVRLWPGDLPP
jgi:hypothetical protein